MANHNPPANGFDKRPAHINRKGRPKSFDAFRELAQAISHEEAKSGGGQLVINNHVVTVAEAILRQWAQSKDPRLQMAFIEVAYGKAPQRVEQTGKDGEPQKLIVEYVNNPYPVTCVSSGASDDTPEFE